MILVTGGAGYIGSHFVKTFLEQNPIEDVVVVDNLSEGHREALDFSNRIHLYTHNIGDVDRMMDVFNTHDIWAVVHFAASCYVGESQTNPTKYFQNNVIQTLNLLKAMEQACVQKLVFSSTCATYGNPVSLPLDETHPQNPINTYGLTKLMIEQALKGYHETIGLSSIALRYFNAAGADDSGLMGEHHDPETHLIPLVLQTALGQRPAIEVYGDDYDTPDGTCIRDYIHVKDLAMAHCQALNRLNNHSVCEAFNLGTTHGASVQEVIDVCRDVTGREITVKTAPRRAGDPAILVANADKAKAILQWETQFNLRQIVESAWQWEQHRRF